MSGPSRASLRLFDSLPAARRERLAELAERALESPEDLHATVADLLGELRDRLREHWDQRPVLIHARVVGSAAFAQLQVMRVRRSDHEVRAIQAASRYLVERVGPCPALEPDEACFNELQLALDEAAQVLNCVSGALDMPELLVEELCPRPGAGPHSRTV